MNGWTEYTGRVHCALYTALQYTGNTVHVRLQGQHSGVGGALGERGEWYGSSSSSSCTEVASPFSALGFLLLSLLLLLAERVSSSLFLRIFLEMLFVFFLHSLAIRFLFVDYSIASRVMSCCSLLSPLHSLLASCFSPALPSYSRTVLR